MKSGKPFYQLIHTKRTKKYSIPNLSGYLYEDVVKRGTDILVSATALVVLSPVFGILALLIKREDGGPVFFLAPRIGRDCKKFTMLKFRGMYVGAPDIRNADGSTYNAEDDFRMTKIGRFMRETSLDELPQLVNVLKGEMSLVGPRPGTWDMLDTYTGWELDKMKARPGITGYTQAYFRNGIDSRSRRVYDAWYANHVSMTLDFGILARTVRTVLHKEHVYSDDRKRETYIFMEDMPMAKKE